MNSEQRFDLHVTCRFCGHTNQLSVATVSLPENHALNCSVCGGAVGTVAEAKRTREAGAMAPGVAP